MLDEEVVGESVYVEGEADVGFGGCEDGLATGATGIVDEDGRGTEGGADARSGRLDGGGRG